MQEEPDGVAMRTERDGLTGVPLDNGLDRGADPRATYPRRLAPIERIGKVLP